MTPDEWETACERLDDLVAEIIKQNPEKVAQAKARPALAGWFVGQAMKATSGKMPPFIVNESVKYHLGI